MPRFCKLVCLSAVFFGCCCGGKPLNSNQRRILKAHFLQFTCIANSLQPWYEVLKNNALSVATLQEILKSCNHTRLRTAPPGLTSNGKFLSSFFLRNCESLHMPGEKIVNVQNGPADAPQESALATEPKRMVPTPEELLTMAPNWLWNAEMYDKWDREYMTYDIAGYEHQLVHYPLFTQNQTAAQPMAPRWRILQMKEWDHQPADVLEYGPGKLWIKPELWCFHKGQTTDFHYDYDPHNVVFQVVGSRRFHIMPPNSGALSYTPLPEPQTKPIDYGTRWAPNGIERDGHDKEHVIELRPRELLVIPNGWPHKVEYLEESIGFSVRSWTQCQALSLWLGQRLCLLSTMLGAERICFDDEEFREYGRYRLMEAGAEEEMFE